MFNSLGQFVSRHWLITLISWVTILALARLTAPQWRDVTLDGDFAYLPERMTSVRGQRLLEEAFPERLSRSQAVIVLAREGVLTAADYELADALEDEFTPQEGQDSPIVNIYSHRTEVFGDKFVSSPTENPQATIVMLQLRNEFMAVGNMDFMKRLYRRLDEIRASPKLPAGLELAVTGSAALGYDMLASAERSIRNTEMVTVLLVVVILLLVYRAPGLVLVPLATIFLSVSLAKGLLAALVRFSASYGWFEFKVFKTTEIFIIVILFGAGTDFCLFLISRYREELLRGMRPADALSHALRNVGGALVGSAATTIVGLGMMRFAHFGKFHNGGPAIAIALAVALLACLTLTPALLRAAGLLVFWPFARRIHEAVAAGPQADESAEPSLTLGGRFWLWSSGWILARAGAILVIVLAALSVPAVRGLNFEVTYDLVRDLDEDLPGLHGTQLLRRYFPAGETGPITVLARIDRPMIDETPENGSGKPRPTPRPIFDTDEGRDRISKLTKFLFGLGYVNDKGETILPIRSVRSLTEPLGSAPGSFVPLSKAGRQKIAVLENPRTKAAFVSQAGAHAFKVTRFDLVLDYDPFSRESIELLNYIDDQLKELAQDSSSPWSNATFEFVGTTAGIRDLQSVVTSDRELIQRLVVLAVLAVLVVLLRTPIVCLYLILTVLLSYFVTIGAADFLFSYVYGKGYDGLDWKVPLFLFVILVAVGQDYNIYLVTRVQEEQARLGIWEGLRRALIRTGGIITSCGVIMAGTFISMMAGTLRSTDQLGFALSFGVMLDTLVVRTILVPAFLVLWQRRQTVPSQAMDDTEVPSL